MSLLLGWLTLPVLGAPRLVLWLGSTVAQEAQREFLDEGRIRSEIAELQQQYDAGEVAEAEYDRREKSLLERLQAVREFKARQAAGDSQQS